MPRHSLLALTFFLLASCSRPAQEIVLSGPTMGTTYHIKIAAPAARLDRAATQRAVNEILARIDRQMSGYRGDSEISRFNSSTSTDWFDVSSDVVAVVDEALSVASASDGALDITVGPLVDLWGFGHEGEPAELPKDDLIDTTRATTGYQKLHTRANPPALRKDVADLAVDLNAVAPGYAVDVLAERLVVLGVEHFMIDIGGEVRARGRNAQGSPWRIAVERPIDANPEPYAIVQLNDEAVTTSGEYRHYYERDGRRYSHTIDPRTGRPVEHRDLASVVVISPTAMNADAWATALNVLGDEAGYALAVQRKIPAMFILLDGATLRARMTPGFEAYLVAPPSSSVRSP